MSLKEDFLEVAKELGLQIYETRTPEGYPENMHLRVSGDNGNWEGIVVCVEEEELFVFHINLGYRVPESKKREICEYMLYGNYGYKHAQLLLEPGSDLALVRIIQRVNGARSERLNYIRVAMYQCVAVADREYLALGGIISGKSSDTTDGVSREEIEKMFEELSDEEIADMLVDMAKEDRDRVLNVLTEDEAARILGILRREDGE